MVAAKPLSASQNTIYECFHSVLQIFYIVSLVHVHSHAAEMSIKPHSAVFYRSYVYIHLLFTRSPGARDARCKTHPHPLASKSSFAVITGKTSFCFCHMLYVEDVALRSENIVTFIFTLFLYQLWWNNSRGYTVASNLLNPWFVIQHNN